MDAYDYAHADREILVRAKLAIARNAFLARARRRWRKASTLAYAEAYAAYRFDSRNEVEMPERRDVHGLSYLAAHAVLMLAEDVYREHVA